MDIVYNYGLAKGWELRPRTVLVEGTSDVGLFSLAADLYRSDQGHDLLADLAIVAAGLGDRGGTRGVVRELITLRSISDAYLSPQGTRVYRCIGLFDNDDAGRRAIGGARNLDASILEYRDVFRLHPVMPLDASLDPAALERKFVKDNIPYKGLDWELEDLISEELVSLFLEEYPNALRRHDTRGDAIHRELTPEGKRDLLEFCRANADLRSLHAVVTVIHALRKYMRLPSLI